MSNPYTEILNQILTAMLPQINDSIGNAIRTQGLDPYPHVDSGSKDFSVGKASYSVTNLTGLSSINIQTIEVSNVSGNPPNLSGDLAMHVVFGSNLSAEISGDVKIIYVDPGISGSLTISGATTSGNATFNATIEGPKICLTNINMTSADFNYASADANINGAGIINDVIKPLEDVILNAVKGKIRSLISGQVKDVINKQVGGILPQCKNL